MALEFRCRDVGMVCRHVEKAGTREDLLAAVAVHARRKHGVELNHTLTAYALTKVTGTGTSESGSR